MTNPMQSDPDRLRVALDHGEVVELDGGTLVLDGAESPSVVLRLAPWRARSVARVLAEWSAASRVFHRAPRPVLSELELSRTLDLAASVLGEPEPVIPMRTGGRAVNEGCFRSSQAAGGYFGAALVSFVAVLRCCTAADRPLTGTR
jgi:hypothetical protein